VNFLNSYLLWCFVTTYTPWKTSSNHSCQNSPAIWIWLKCQFNFLIGTSVNFLFILIFNIIIMTNLCLFLERNDIYTTKEWTTLNNSLSSTVIIFSHSLSSSHFIFFVVKENEGYPKSCQLLDVQITQLLLRWRTINTWKSSLS
jgi:hypothetical protein